MSECAGVAGVWGDWVLPSGLSVIPRPGYIHNHCTIAERPRVFTNVAGFFGRNPCRRSDFRRTSGRRPAPLEGRRVSVEQKVIEIVCEHLAVNKEQVTRNTNFIEDIGADSLDIVELIMELEEEFDIQIPDDQAEKIKTVGEAIDYIERETKKK
jgi:acyl carrier protein